MKYRKYSILAVYFVLLANFMQLPTAHAEKNTVLIKSPRSFQINPKSPNDNKEVFIFKKVISECLEEKNIDFKVVASIINQKTVSTFDIPTITCQELIDSYRKKKL